MKKIIFLFSLLFAATPVLSQSLSIFDIDTTSFPIMKAKIFAIDAEGKQVTGINPSDFSLTENSVPREIISVSCPSTKPAERISSTIVIDVSGSMSGGPLDIAKTMAKTWVNALPLGQSDCALVSFNGSNYFNQDFTTNRNKLLSAIDGLSSDDGTDYNAALINPVAGGILTAKAGKHRKVIVFITDGQPNNPPDEARIIEEAQANGIMIHCITIGLPAHSSMIHFAEQTHGMFFENVKTEEEAKSIAQMLLGRSVYDFLPCEIQWKSDFFCERRFIDVALNWNSSSVKARYYSPENGIAKIVMNPVGVRFINKPIGIKADTIISITAVNADFNISDFNFSDSRFSIYPSMLNIGNGETKEVTLSFTPTDSTYCFSYIDIQNDRCVKKNFAASVYPNSKLKASTLKLTSPNGSEEFQVGTDTLITWTGVLPNDTIKLEYSYDNGATWNLITESASGLEYVWKDIPKPASKKCLVRATTINVGVNVEWEKIYGNFYEDIARKIIQTKQGYLIVGSLSKTKYSSSSDVWVIYLNNLGDTIWTKTFGGLSREDGITVIELDDGSFILGANTESDEVLSSKGYLDYWIMKLDINGNIIWSKRYGGSSYDLLSHIGKTNDGGFLAIGSSSSNNGDASFNHGAYDAWIVKLDSAGNVKWQKSIGGSKWDHSYDFIQTADSCFVIIGSTESNDGDIIDNKGDHDCWIIKISSDGSLLWSKTFGGSLADYLTSINEIQNDGYIVSGVSKSNDGDIKNNHSDGFEDALIAKLNIHGDLQGIKLLGGSSNDRAQSLIKTSDDGFVFIGSTQSDDGDVIPTPNHNWQPHLWIVKLNDFYDIMWSKVLDKYFLTYGTSIQQTYDNGFIISGYVEPKHLSEEDYLIIKFSRL